MPAPAPVPSRHFIDPRLLSGFQAAHYPLCGGSPAPPPITTDRHERRCLEFLAAYYRINFRQAIIRNSDAPSPADRSELLDAVAALEALEDRYAPAGFFGDPVMDDYYYTDIHFTRPQLSGDRGQTVVLTSHVAIPGLEHIPLSELTGTVTTTRWTYGEAHP